MIMYHWTTVENYESIRRSGLRVNQKANFLLSSADIMERIYGCIPICLSTNKTTKYADDPDSVCLKVDVSGLRIVTDIFSMVDHGAYIEESCIWFSRTPRGFSQYVDKEEKAISYEDMLSDTDIIDSCVKLTKSACVCSDIEPSRLTLVTIRVK